VFQPFTLLLIRFLSAALVMLPFVIQSKELNPRVFRQLLPVGLVGSLNPILLFIGLQFTPASISPLIYAAVPLMTAIYFQQVKHTSISTRNLQGIIVGFIGVAIVFLLPLFQQGSVDFSGLWGNFLILGAAIAFMFYGIISKERMQQVQVSPLALTFYLSIVTILVSIPFALVEVTQNPIAMASVQPKHLLSGLAIGIFGTSMFYISYQKAVRLGNELTASLFTYLQPISTILLASVMLGETITLPFLVGGTLAILGARWASIKTAPLATNLVR
jgi:drug/metabolite transporter (DMT)-like permease